MHPNKPDAALCLALAAAASPARHGLALAERVRPPLCPARRSSHRPTHPGCAPTAMQELLPGILSQLGAEAIPNLKQLMETLAQSKGLGGGQEEEDDVAEVEGTFADADEADAGNVD